MFHSSVKLLCSPADSQRKCIFNAYLLIQQTSSKNCLCKKLVAPHLLFIPIHYIALQCVQQHSAPVLPCPHGLNHIKYSHPSILSP